MHIVGGDYFEIKLFRELEQARDDFFLLGDAVVLDFDEIVFATEDIDKFCAGSLSFFPAIMHEVLRNQRSETTRETDQPIGILSESLHIGPRFVVKSLQMRVGHEFEEILVTSKVTREQAEVEEGLAVVGSAVLFEARGLHEVEFAADQGFHAGAFGRVVEGNGSEEITVVRQR